MSLVNWKNIDTSLLYICSPEQVSTNGHIFEIKYSKSELVIHTPRTMFVENPRIFLYNNRQYIKVNLCFYNYEFNDEVRNFINSILNIENKISNNHKTLWKNINKTTKNKTFVSSIYFNDTKTKAYLSLSIQTETNNNISKPVISVYDKYKNIKDIDYIIPSATSYNIIYLRNVWQKGNKMGLNWVILQSKVYHPIYKLDECLIMDPFENNPNSFYNICSPSNNPTNINNNTVNNTIKIEPPSEEHPIFGKYVKMKRMKIPDGAIQSKCMMEGINYTDFLNYINPTANKDISNIPPVMPNIPPPFLLSSLPKTENVNKITANMLLSVKLKKNNSESSDKQIIQGIPVPKKIYIENPSGFKPPSASDLLNVLNRLKKISK
jgi:hypothetical protein